MTPGMLTLVLAAFVAVLYALTHLARKRFGVGAGTISPDSLRIVGKRTLEARKSLYVIQVADRYVLVGSTESGISLIDRISVDEFATMVPQDELDHVPSVAKKRRAQEAASADQDITALDLDSEPTELTLDADDADDAETLAARIRESGRSATLGEGFQYLMSKARRSTSSHERVAAGVAAANSDEDTSDSPEPN